MPCKNYFAGEAAGDAGALAAGDAAGDADGAPDAAGDAAGDVAGDASGDADGAAAGVASVAADGAADGVGAFSAGLQPAKVRKENTSNDTSNPYPTYFILTSSLKFVFYCLIQYINGSIPFRNNVLYNIT